MFPIAWPTLVRITVLAATMLFAALGAAPVMAAPPMVKTPAPGYFRLMLGEFEVTVLSDGTVDVPADKLLSEPAAKTVKTLAKAFLKTPVETSVNAYLINTGNKLVLIDTGAGSLFGPTLGKLISSMKASGYEPGQVDEVFLSHLHPDHAGGLTANGAMTFPNAVVRLDQQDADFWLSKDKMNRAPAASKGFFEGAMASLEPYVAAKKVRPFKGNTELLPGIRSYAGHGHTVGHTVYAVESQAQKLVLVGDLIHVAAVQLDNPAVTIAYDSDAKAAAFTRQKFFAQAAREGALVGASHIQFPGLGHLRAAGKSYQWLPVNYTQMR
jgi:glyoxylase-like metal-dependent hydrolase (beta-lactamase superfamily II)